jgi:hypothetical protein
MNRYVYVNGNPVNAVDPSGTEGRAFFGIDTDDRSPTRDFTPQGTGWGRHSYDWMGQMGTPVMGRLDEILLDVRLPRAAADLARMSASTGIPSDCLRSAACTNLAVALQGPAEQTYQVASLDFIERAIARTAYSRNPTLRNNIESILEQAAGRQLSSSEVRSILNDVMRGPSTELSNLQALGSIRVGSSIHLTNTQFGIINTYVRELPLTPLNNEIRRGWQRWVARRAGN